jgi:hypothetical protein
MAIVFTNTGRTLSASYTVGKTTTTENLILRLYSNDYTPNPDSESLNFTEVTSGGGYLSYVLNGEDWSISDGAATYPQQQWLFVASKGNIYGYYVTLDTGEVIFAERFSNGPFNIASNGDIIRVNINFTLGQNS